MEKSTYDTTIARYYDEVISQGYHTQNEYLEELKRIIPVGASVLELGCGTGEIILPFSASGRECEGLDQSDSMLYRLKEKGSGIKTHLSNIMDFISNREYDFALSCSGVFSIKGGELESYLLERSKVEDCLRRFSAFATEGLLINMGNGKDGLEIELPSGLTFRHREIRDRDYMIMIHLLYRGDEMEFEATHVKRRFLLSDLLVNAHVEDYERFKLIKF